MIGLYTQNKTIQAELLQLLQDVPVEIYQPGHEYLIVIWLDDKAPPKNLPVLLAQDLPLPLTTDQWHLFLKKYMTKPICYENKFFKIETAKRQLINLKTKQTLDLTEKENELWAFLIQAPTHSATRETLLKTVWQYNPETQTHTIESHLYSLKQKIGKNANKLLHYQNGIVSLL